MMLNDNHIADLMAFIEKLETTTPLSPPMVKKKRDAYQKKLNFDYLYFFNRPWQEQEIAKAKHRKMVETEQFDNPLVGMDLGQEATRIRQQDFAANLKTTCMFFDRFLRTGEDPLHGYTARLGVLLRKAKLFDLSDQLNTAWFKHFPDARLKP